MLRAPYMPCDNMCQLSQVDRPLATQKDSVSEPGAQRARRLQREHIAPLNCINATELHRWQVKWQRTEGLFLNRTLTFATSSIKLDSSRQKADKRFTQETIELPNLSNTT